MFSEIIDVLNRNLEMIYSDNSEFHLMNLESIPIANLQANLKQGSGVINNNG